MKNFLRLFCFLGLGITLSVAPLSNLNAVNLTAESPSSSKSTSQKPSDTPSKSLPKTNLRLVVIGDSLVEGYGVSKEQTFPSLLEAKLKEIDSRWSVINAGISGSTSGSALARVRWQLKDSPDMIMIVLGANDGLRGLSVTNMKENLRKALQAAVDKEIPVILAGMQMPPNYSKEYREPFAKAFTELGKMKGVTLVPFLLEGVAGEPSLNLADGIHPNEKGQKKIAETVAKVVLPLAKANKSNQP